MFATILRLLFPHFYLTNCCQHVGETRLNDTYYIVGFRLSKQSCFFTPFEAIGVFRQLGQ